LLGLVIAHAAAAGTKAAWHPERAAVPARSDIRVRHGRHFELDRGRLAHALAGAPGKSTGPAVIVSLPRPDGTFERFALHRSPVLARPYQSVHPEIETFAGVSVDDPDATIHADLTPLGFHASVLRGRSIWYIDPTSRDSDGAYVSYYGHALVDTHGGLDELPPLEGPGAGSGPAAVRAPAAAGDAVSLRVYRLALVSDPSYATYFGTSNVDAAKATLVSRISQIYEQELDIRLTLVASSSLDLNTAAQATGTNGPCGASACFTSAQLAGCDGPTLQRLRTVVGELVSASSYDVGHLVLGQNGGGLAFLSVVGRPYKAAGCTGIPNPVGDGYAVDYVAHELGHQFGANHTFNGISGSCAGGNRAQGESVEPGSGSSIMAYAGICGADDLQLHSDPYFAARSRDEILDYVESDLGDGQELQTAFLSGFGGSDSFKLVYDGQKSATITRGVNYTAGGIQTALASIPGFPSGAGANVLGVDGTGSPGDQGFSLQFFGSLATADVDPVSLSDLSGLTAIMTEIDNGGQQTNGGSSSVVRGDKAPGVSGPGDFSIPVRTPFALTASGTDVDGDPLTYLWEQDDQGGNAGTALLSNTKTNGPLFRIFGTALQEPPYDPTEYESPGENLATTDPTRVFPDMAQILAGNTNAKTGSCPATNIACFSEFLPTAAYVGASGVNSSPPRLHFRVSARDGSDGLAEAETTLTLVPTAGPFLVTSQGDGAGVEPGSTVAVTWNVAGTASAPISVANVKISLSLDGGLTWPDVLAASTPNDGSQSVTLPLSTTAHARIKVEALGNVFFDVSDADFPIANDTTAPDTSIDSGPGNSTNDTTPTFTFSSESGATFECRLESLDWTACDSPFTADPLADGAYIFRVRAIDQAANVDPTPATRSFTVDTTGPVTTITAGPRGRITDSSTEFKFASEPGTFFTCSVDGDAVPCSSPYATEPLSVGNHTFAVFGTDHLGNVGPTVSRSFSYAHPLQTTIHLVSTASDGSAKFRMTGSGGLPPLGFDCRLTGKRATSAQKTWKACATPKTYKRLKSGSYVFWARSRDSDGVVDKSPDQLSFSIHRR
jgi:hypothetical protein